MIFGDSSLSETDIRSPNARVTTIRADASDRRPWLAQAPVCPMLATRQICHVAVAEMPAPFEIVRTRLSGSYFLAGLAGEGRVRVDGRWTRCLPGRAVLLPPGTLQAFRTPPKGTWQFCWVRYQESPGQKPLALAQTPVIARFNAEPLRHAILGLFESCRADASPSLLDSWCELIHRHVLHFAQPATMDSRIAALWQKVSADLGREWSLGEMSHEVHVGEKQLQRLCRRELGRTPRQHLIWLRMRQAAELLVLGAGKIDVIAGRVGYENPFVFSSTFKRVMGCSPSEYAERRH